MPIRVLPGEPHDGRSEPFLLRLERAAKGKEPPGKFLYLVRTALRQKLLRGSILEKTGGGYGVPVQELPAWALSLSEYLPDRKPLADETAARFLAEKAVRELAKEKNSFFARTSHLENLPARLAGLVGELTRAGVSSGRILPPEIARFLDLFEKIRLESGIDTPDSRIAALAPAIRAGKFPKERLPEETVLEGFYEISPVALELLRAVSETGCDVTFLIDTPGKEEPWTRLPEELRRQLQAVPEPHPRPSATPSPFTERGKGGEVNQILSLLSPTAEKKKTECPPWLHLRLGEDASPASEIDTIARKIRDLAAGDPALDLSGVGVVFCDVAEAAPLVRETFTRLGIPYDLAEEENLPSSPPGIAAGAALSLLRENLSRRSIRRAFSQGLLVFRPEDGLSKGDLGPWNASRLDHLAREAGLLDDETDWDERLGSLLQKKRARLETFGEEETLSTFDFEREREKKSREIQEIENLLKSLASLRQEKDRLFPNRRMDGWAFAAALRDWLHTLRLPRRIARLADLPVGRTGAPLEEVEKRGLSERERLLRRDAAAWRRIEKLLAEFASAARAGGAIERPPVEWASLFTKLLEEEKFLEEPYGQGKGRVRVMGRLDLRQLSFEHLFVAGLNEGEFPTRRRPDPFLSDSARRILGLATQERSAAEADHLLALAFFSAKKSLHLSAPRGQGGEELLPAPALLELSRYLFSSPEKHSPPAPTGPKWAQERLGRELSGGEMRHWGPAVLQELKRQGGLLSPPHTLARCESVWERSKRDALSSYDGMVESPATLAALSRLFENHVFSASQFETYARCPIQYFFRYALGIESPEEPLREFTALDRGRLLHRILQRYYEGEGAAHLKELWRGAPEELLSKALSSLSRIAREEVEGASLSLVERDVYLELLLGGAADGNEKGLLGRLLTFEREDLGGAFEPGFAEKGFGKRWGTEPVELDGPEGAPLLLNGSVDRVDLLAGPGKGFRLFDYKTGPMNDARRGMALGLYLQLPLYGLAIEKLLGEGHEFLGGAYYVVNEEKGAKTEEALCAKEDARLLGITKARNFLAQTREDLGRFVRRVRDRAFEIRGHILRGRFHPTIHGSAAARC